MKRLLITISLFLFFAWIACSKYRNTLNDIASKTAISLRGRLFLYDSITGNYDTVPLTKQLISLGYAQSTNPLNYIYTATTDSLGYFTFQYLDSTQSYHLNYTDTGSNAIVYMADTILRPGNNSLAFIAYPSFHVNNGALYHFVTAQDTSGPVPGVSVCIFANAGVISDTSCLGSTWSLISDNHGRVSLFHLTEGTYYSRIHAGFPNLTITLIDTLNIPATGLVVKKIRL